MNRRYAKAIIAAAVCCAQPLWAESLTLNPSKDNTLYEDAAGALSNGAGDYLFAGAIASTPLKIRRTVLAFDLSAIPAGSTINSASLTLYVDRLRLGGPINLHSALANWGEGGSDAGGDDIFGGGGAGTTSMTGDATWKHTFYDQSLWTNLGGDFVATSSQSASVMEMGDVTFNSSAQLVADVQGWVNGTTSNFGWFIRGQENASLTAVRFRSSEHSNSAQRPRLMIDYTLGTVVGTATWNNATGGNWSLPGNWNGSVPNAAGSGAVFGAIIGATAQTITVDAPQTVGSITFNNAAGTYTIGGTALLTIDGGTSDGSIDVVAGNHAISAPVNLAKNTSVAVPENLTLTMGEISGAATATLNKTGSGLLEVKHVRTGGLSVSAGSAKITANGTSAATSKVSSLSITGTGKLDLTNNAMVIDHDGTSPLNTVRNQIKTGYATGDWSGNGLITSLGTTTGFGVGYAERSALGVTLPGIFSSVTVDDTALLVRGTRFGDSDMDADVDLDDVGRWSLNFTGELGGTGSKVWTEGDWDYDGDVDLDDVGRWSLNFTGELGGGAALELDQPIHPTALAALQSLGISVVPEPAALAMLGLPFASLALRRRRET